MKFPEGHEHRNLGKLAPAFDRGAAFARQLEAVARHGLPMVDPPVEADPAEADRVGAEAQVIESYAELFHVVHGLVPGGGGDGGGDGDDDEPGGPGVS